MKCCKLRFVYGQEFWDLLESLIKGAKKRVVVISAFQGPNTYEWLKEMLPKEVFFKSFCRSDNMAYFEGKRKKFIPPNATEIKSKLFHGKIYLVDNHIILGSQNLYNVKLENKKIGTCKEGEFSVFLTLEEIEASKILYQALIKIIQNENIKAEPYDPQFESYYEYDCPFCGNQVDELFKCPHYGDGFVSEEECGSYGDDGACKYCFQDIRLPIQGLGCTECGVGIDPQKRELIYHAINPLKDRHEHLEEAKQFLRIYKFLNLKKDDTQLLHKLGFLENVYQFSLFRDEIDLINLKSIERLFSGNEKTIGWNDIVCLFKEIL